MSIIREFLFGFIKIHVLYHSEKKAICGVDMMKELRRHGYSVGPGTIYPILHRMKTSGYLVTERKVQDGKVRIYYSATDRGRLALKLTKPKIRELVSEVVD